MRKISQEELEQILKEHSDWLKGNGGKRTNLRGANLEGADLGGANLRYANLEGAYLKGMNVQPEYIFL